MHRNSHQNEDPHHLYEIYDKQEEETFKYGISSDEIDEEGDGLSNRIRRQLNLFNLAAGWLRYFARILIINIPGRKVAEQIEDEFIDSFIDKHGRNPRGNLRKNKPNSSSKS